MEWNLACTAAQSGHKPVMTGDTGSHFDAQHIDSVPCVSCFASGSVVLD